MKTIDLYLIREISVGLIISTVVLIPLFGFLDLLEQLDDVGEEAYRIDDAFLYVFLMIPRRFIQLTPFIALLGNVMALGALASNRELIAMRIAGLSPARITYSSLKVGLVLVLFIGILEQFVAPPLQQKAIALRSEALAKSTELGKGLGIWTRDERRILHIGAVEYGRRANMVEIFTLDNSGVMVEYIYAEYADILNGDEWVLYDVIRKTINENQVDSQRIDSLTWEPFLDPDQISTLTKPAESLSLTNLYRYVNYLQGTGQGADAYSLALWRKIGGGLITIAMVLLSAPFVIGSLRARLGSRMVIAGVMGIGVYVLDQIVANAGLILELSPPLVALTPGILLICAAIFWLQRVP